MTSAARRRPHTFAILMSAAEYKIAPVRVGAVTVGELFGGVTASMMGPDGVFAVVPHRDHSVVRWAAV